MKKSMFAAFLAILFVAGCQPKMQDKPVDLAALKDSITLVIDNYLNAVNSRDLETYSTLLADDGLFCGSDPGEFWNKKGAVDLMKQQFADTNFIWKLSPDKQEIKVSPDGKSAIIVNQYLIKELSPKIPMREITHLIKTDNGWQISFNCWNFIIENENVAKLNSAL